MDSGLTIAMNGQAALEKWVAYQFENLQVVSLTALDSPDRRLWLIATFVNFRPCVGILNSSLKLADGVCRCLGFLIFSRERAGSESA